MKRINKVTIIGVGLIGGSIGLEIKRRKLALKVVGVGHQKSSVANAIRLKTIDEGTLSVADGVKGADFVILATPVLTMLGIIKKAKSSLKKGCIITDVGSSKRMITRTIEKTLPSGVSFVGAHPMAGSQQRGVDAARAGLFKGSLCILTKSLRTKTKALNSVRSLWKTFGAKVVVLTPDTHDRIVSEISHMPHMVAFSLLNSVDAESLKFASTGFRDTTRIASSDAYIWKDIAISNSREIVKSIKKFMRDLASIERSLKKKDSAALVKLFKKAKTKREGI